MAIRAVVFDIGGVLELDVIELVDSGLDGSSVWACNLGSWIGACNRYGGLVLWVSVLRRMCIRRWGNAWT